MSTFTYNDMTFDVAPAASGWTISRWVGSAPPTVVATAVFAGLDAAEAQTRAISLVKRIFPVGVRVVGPDVAHPNRIGDLRIVGPDVSHPNFIYWDKDSSSFPAQA